MAQHKETSPSYKFVEDGPSHTHAYLWQPIEVLLSQLQVNSVFDLGCGNGAFLRRLKGLGFHVAGVDPSEDGIKIARQVSPRIQLEIGSCYDDLGTIHGQFDCVVSLEVIEHVYSPKDFTRCVAGLLDTGGKLILSTPYHGYLKNLALALSGKMDDHFTALWDHGHIKFWSIKTISELLDNSGFFVDDIVRVGRWAPLAKSMIVVATKR